MDSLVKRLHGRLLFGGFVMRGKLIVTEGLDGSGKATQTERLFAYLQEKGSPVSKVSFPDYDSPSSSLVKMYLAGDF